MLSEAIECTDVGQLRDHLDAQLNQCLLSELVESPRVSMDPAGGDPGGVTTDPGEEASESIFDYGSKMGQLPHAEGGYWIHDKTTATLDENYYSISQRILSSE